MPRNPPEGYHTITPQTIVGNAQETIEFLRQVFDAKVSQLYEDDGRVVHSEVEIGDSKIMIASASDEFGEFPLMVNLYVDDVDAAFAKAIENGATALREPEDQFYGDRTSGVLDSQGNQWWISAHVEDVAEAEMRRRMSEMSG